MRAFVPLAMMIVPGAAYAQPLEQVAPDTVAALPAPWTSETAAVPIDIDGTGPLTSFEFPALTAVADPQGNLADVAIAATAPAEDAIAAEDAAPAENAGTAQDAVLAAADAASIAGAPVALTEQADALFAAEPVSEGELAEAKGKALESPMVAIANSSSNVNNNYVGANSTTGTVNIADTAFQGSSGFAMVNINTGNASSIIGTMSVNVQINYAPIGQ